MDKIGLFKGQLISEMSRKNLLDFASWTSRRIESLEKVTSKYQSEELETEMLKRGFVKTSNKVDDKTICNRGFGFFLLWLSLLLQINRNGK